MRNKFELTKEVLDELFSYDPFSGKLFWKRRELKYFAGHRHYVSWNNRFEGKEALTAKNNEGYFCGTVLGNNVKAHRLIWVIFHGVWPETIDHINGNKSDNRIENLRDVSLSINLKNQKMKNTNTSGRVGIFWHKATQKWQAAIGSKREYITLGFFSNKEEAIQAREKAEKNLEFHENHGRIEP